MELVYDLLKGVLWIHMQGMAHRDIKPERIGYLKRLKKWCFIDFGESDFYFEHPKRELTIIKGTLYYLPTAI